MDLKVRVTGVLVEQAKILLLEQDVVGARRWSLPSGALEFGETIEECLIREMQEETGLLVAIEGLLYICDRLHDDQHVVHLTLLVRRTGGELALGAEPEPGSNRIKAVKMVPLPDLPANGFSSKFRELVIADFPDRGTYQGDISNIGL